MINTNNCYDISVIIASYNPDTQKLLNTLNAVLMQKKIGLEIIITDDGSEIFPKDEVLELARSKNAEIRLILNEENQGTVRNFLNAAVQASGKYVFLTSPGDYLYDEYTLARFFRFAEKRQAKVAFGNAVNYYQQDGETVFENNMDPARPQFFNSKNNTDQQIYYLFLSKILGATFLRERTSFIRYLEKIAPVCRYIEDFSTSACYLLEGGLISYYNRNIVWYEYGTGISTSKSSLWEKTVADELDALETFLAEEYDSDIVEAYNAYRKAHSQLRKKTMLIADHPYIAALLFVGLSQRKKSKKLDIQAESKKFKRMLLPSENEN